MKPVLQTDGLVKVFGGLTATDNLCLSIESTELHALIGPNGAGKSTLIGQLTGAIAPDRGTVRFAGRDVTSASQHARARMGLARSFQITSIFAPLTVIENVAVALRAASGGAFHFWTDIRGEKGTYARARELLAQVGLSKRAERAARNLGHGEQRQLEVALAMATSPKLLLLDEPMAGMSGEESQLMVGLLKRLKGRVPMLLVEHDMEAVFQLADRISVLVAGRIIASGTPAQIREDAGVRSAYLGDLAS